MLLVIEKKWDIIYIQILLAATEGATENIGEGLHLRNVKHYTPWKSMYSKYWLIKVLENGFINMDCFSWIRLIPFLIHLKYWYYNSLCLKLPCLSHYFCQILSYPSETLFNTVLIMFSSASLFFPTSLDYKAPQVLNIPNHIPSRDNQIYYQAIFRLEYLIGQARYQSKGWIFRIRFSFKVIQHGQWQLCLQYNVSWILYKCSLIFIILLVHSTNATILTKKPFLYFSQFPPTYPTFTCSQNHPYNPQ